MRLGKIAHLEAGAQLNFAAKRRELPKNCFQKCGLASPIGADQCHAFAAFQHQVGAAKERFALVFIAYVQVVGAQDQIA